MDLLSKYADSDNDDDDEEEKPQLSSTYIPLKPKTACAPTTLTTYERNAGTVSLFENRPLNASIGPVHGPAHPFKFRNGCLLGSFGNIETTAMEDWTFNQQYQTYQKSGYAIDSSTNSVIGDQMSYFNDTYKKQTRIKRQREGDDDIEDYTEGEGPWAEKPKSESETQKVEAAKETAEVEEEVAAAPVVDVWETDLDRNTDPTMHIQEPDEEDEKWEKVNERKLSFTLPKRPARGSVAPSATSTFHGQSKFDYQGRSWVCPPSGTRPDDGDHDCYIPKKCVKKYTGHTKGVQAIEFFPGTGHLLFSASLDGKCKVWDVATDRNVRCTYSGHTEAVRSMNLSNDGSEFLSSAFDRYIRLWDTETGQAKATFSNRKMSYCVRFNPGNNNQFIAACNDNQLYAWDARSGQVTQAYNHHLQPVNTVLFFEGGRKFVSTSDDKKVLVWENDIPVPIKYIAEPEMFSIPSLTMHPSGEYFAGQSMDNTIVVYSCGDKVNQIKKKTFRGHNNTGFACQIGFSPDGKFITSGDGVGKLHVWDWKSCKPYRKFQAHEEKACYGSIWHPLHPSLVATCGWDGVIKLWE